jgi:signal transduction histidine kinase
MESAFAELEALVGRHFEERRHAPERGTVEVLGERYVLVRAASLSVEFFRLCEELFGEGREAEAAEFARNILFDLAHAIGKSDAQSLHARLGLTDPEAKMAAGPIHFAHIGWAFVEISPDSNPAQGDAFCLVYDHPYSFEADAWLRAGQRRDFPVCIMNAGYSSGWCEESYGRELVAVELECRARGDARCHFIMAPPSKLERIVAERFPRTAPTIPDFFSRKRMEDELRRAQSELEKRVAERTAELRVQMEQRELVEKQLRQAHKLEAVGRLAGGVAHDFNNLVAIVLGNCTVLRSRLAPGGADAQLLDDAISACNRAAKLTKQLLAFGRTQAQKRERLDLREVVEETGRMLRALLGEDIVLSLDLAPEACWVEADRSQLDQVIVNLAVNARDAMPNGGALSISVQRTDVDLARGGQLQLSAGPHVRLAVRDEGVGMDDETVQHIFDPFFTTKEGKGSGMGLSTVYGVVRQSGGAISVETRVGRGTEFEVLLPEAAPASVPSEPPRSSPRGGNERVLLVEDEAALRQIVGVILADLGYRVLVADDGAHALRLAGENEIDLLLTDVVMPRMSGPEVARQVRAIRPDVRVLYMSGYSKERIPLEEHRAAWLAKPFDMNELARKLREVLEA